MKSFINNFLLTFALLALPAVLLAQRAISGKVTDADNGEELIGATVQVVGTNIGAVTGVDGSYRINVPANATQIRFAYTGYAERILSLGAGNTLDATLSPSAQIEEVVVIGYGTVKRQDATGALQSVGTKDFNKGPIVAPQELIAGKIAGVQVTPGSDPGSGGTIRIRGGSSLTATNDPLVIIDGIPIDNNAASGSRNALNAINPNDIETFTVLKDASATAIYGSRASNGVILITTKKGTLSKKIGVDFTANFSSSNRLNQLDVLDAGAYRALIEQRFPEGSAQRALLGSSNTNWQDQIYRGGFGQEYNLGVSGSIGGKIPYRVSGGFNDRNGILKTDSYNRLTGALNLNPGFLNNTLQVNIGLKGMTGKNQFGNRGAIGAAAAFDPTQPVTNGSPYGGYYTWLQPNGNPITIATANPVALLEQHTDKSTENRFIANASVDYRFWFLPDLRANLNLAYDKSKSDGSVFEPKDAGFAFASGGLSREYTQEKDNKLLEFYLNYSKKLAAKTNLELMGGYSWQHFLFDNYSYSQNVDGSLIFSPKNYDPGEYYLLSLFGRANLNLFDRVLLTGTLRRDGSSRFAEDNRWGLFPSAAVAVKVLEDAKGPLSNLKLRASYGETGQQDIGGYYPYLPRYSSSQNNAQYQLGEQFITTLRPNGYDANIKWEQTSTINIGADFGLLNNRIFGSIEYYIRKTTDLLNFIPVPAGTNLTNFLTTNVGDLENRGVEFSLNGVVIKQANASWEVGANVTVNKNEITRLTATDDPNYQGVFVGGIAGGVGNTIQVHSVGYPANTFLVYEQVYDDKGVPVEGLYVDRNGDGTVTPADRYRAENPAPKAFFGFYSNYTRGNIDFSFAGRANVGNYVYNNLLSGNSNYNQLYNSAGYLNNVHSQTTALDIAVPQYFSDHFIQNASFLRLDHITLGYTLRNISKLKSLRISASVQNPFVITKYEGLDPEIFGGIDNNAYPRSRTFMLGINAGF